MQRLIVPLRTDVALRPAPIEPAWIIEGDPTACNCVLSYGSDRQALTIVWECTEGKFDWRYDFDETIHFLEGSVVIESETMAPTRFGAGDVLFLARGAHARWTVEKKVRKLAFCHTPAPAPLSLLLKALARLARRTRRARAGARRQPALSLRGSAH